MIPRWTSQRSVSIPQSLWYSFRQMDSVKYAELVLTAIFALLLILKLAEMIKNIVWVFSVQDTFLSSLDEGVRGGSDEMIAKAFEDHGFPFFPGNIWLTRWIGKLHRGDRGKVLTKWLFRYPNLMGFCSASIVMVSQGESWKFQQGVMRLMSLLIFAGILVKASHLLIYRYKFGVLDNWLLSLSVPTMKKTVRRQISRRESLQNFIRIVLSSLGTFLVGYSAIYYCIAKGMIPGNYLTNVNFESPVSIQTLYFSAATLLTVGFGDIWPVGPVAQLAVTSEMLVSLLLLVIFVTAFSATVPTSDNERLKKR